MADMQKPNYPNNANAPQPVAHKGGGVKKFFAFLIILVVVGGGGRIWWHGKQLGEAKAKAAGTPIADAKMVMPWDWTSEDWRTLTSNVQSEASSAVDATAAKADALKAKIAAWRSAKTSATTTATPLTGTPPTTPPTGTPPTPPDNTVATPPANTSPVPEGFTDAAKLVDEGQEAWEKHDYATAKTKLTDAVKQLKPMAEKKPTHPAVAKALELANGLLEDMDMNSPK